MVTNFELVKRAENFREKVREFCFSKEYLDSYAVSWLGENFGNSCSFSELLQDETFGGKSIQVEEPVLLVTPSTGGTTGIVALFWAYIASSKTVTVSYSSEDSTMKSFLGFFSLDEVHGLDIIRLSTLGDSEFEEFLKPFKTVIVYGSDDTLQRYRHFISPKAKFVGYGSKFSIGLHMGDITWRDVVEYFRDLTVYDGLGCLNTSILYVEDLTDHNMKQLEILAKTVKLYYKDNKYAELRQNNFNQDLFLRGHKSIGDVFGLRDVDGTSPLLSGGYGTLYVVDLHRDLYLIQRDLEGFRGYLSSATLNIPSPLGNFFSGRTYLENMLFDVGVQRVTLPGDAQNPLLSWSHDGQGNLAAFVKFLDVE